MSDRTTLTDIFKRVFTEQMKTVGTSIPGHIIAFDPETQLAQLQIGVRGVDENGQQFDRAPLIECPVLQYGGGEYMIEVEINPTDEGIIIFSQRCIDGWVDTGGIAANPILRFHDVQDAYFIPGMRSQPNAIVDHQNDGIRMRNKTATQYVWLKGNGDIDILGTNVIINGINFNSHTHGGVETGAGNTGPAQ